MADEFETIELQDDGAVVVRSADLREIDVRLFPLNKAFRTRQGPEEFAPGATSHLEPNALILQGLEHEAGIGLDQAGQPRITRRPQGRSRRIWEDDDYAYATFKVARTQSGDDILALAEDGIVRGVSIEMDLNGNITEKVMRNGQSVRRITRAALTGAAPTYRPTYGDQASVVAIRSQDEEAGPVAEDVQPAQAGLTDEQYQGLVARTAEAFNVPLTGIMERLEKIEEANRADIVIPGSSADPKAVMDKGEWINLALKVMTGERITDSAMRSLDDIITTDNIGVVPPAYLTELIGVIDPSRPFLSTTRRLPTPSSGIKLIVPVIEQRPEVAVQSAEKQEVASTKTIIGTTEFDMVTAAGAGDLSLQLIKRSSPEFLSLWIELLAEQYARVTENLAVLSLLDAMGGVGNASPMDPSDLELGDAWVAAFDAIRRGPDTIWLSTQAVGEFIDAKANTTNTPLYSNINLNATAAGGVSGSISGLRAVHVPVLDAHGAYAIVGPSSGFAWAEDGTYTLQVDNAAHAGRDVALVGMFWPAPWYPAAFTAYNVAS